MAETRRNRKPQESLRVLLEHLNEGVTGCLSLREAEGAERRVYVMQGEILAAHGPDDGPGVVRRLVNHSAVTERQSEEYLKRLSEGDRLDEILFGQIPDELLLDVLSERFRQDVLDFLLTPGTPDFEPMDAIFVDNIQIGHDSRALVTELEARSERIRVLLAHASAITVRMGKQRPTRLEEARLLDLLEAPARIVDLVAASPYEKGATLDLLWEMLGHSVLQADGAFPADDDEPTEVTNNADDEPFYEMPSSALEVLDVWTAEVAEEPPQVPAASSLVEPEPVAAQNVPVDQEDLTDHGTTPDAMETLIPDDGELRHAAEAALRAQMDAELAAELEAELQAEQARLEDRSVVETTDTGRLPPLTPRTPPPGFSYEGVDVEDDFFRDYDREMGRGGADGTFIGVKDEVVVLRAEEPVELRGDKPAERRDGEAVGDEESVIEAQDLESLPEEARAGIRSLTFSAPPLAEDEAYNAFEIVNEALREISHVLDEINGPGAGRAFVQLLLEGTPAEFATLFRAVDARKDGSLPIELVLKNLADRPRSEHRQLVHRGVEDLVERALTLSCEELDDDAADQLAERVLGYQKQLGF